jgi:glyoxylase-like metal-dependent hydrolase (beta-lactamase superfamily II)
MKLGGWHFRAYTDGLFRLDGGSMFGVVPRVLWEKQHPPDGMNRIQLTLRCLVADGGGRRFLIDTGLGDRWDDKGKGMFDIERRPAHLLSEFALDGVSPESITDVILTHLHFDHCGGAVRRDGDQLKPAFPAARYWVQKQQWNWASSPTERDRASFRSDDFAPLADAGCLELVDGSHEIAPGVRVRPIHGHTPGQQMVEFHTDDGVVAYCGDLIPFASQVHAPWIMGFDLNPLLTLTEKKEFLSRASEDEYVLVFEHDPVVEAATVEFADDRFRIKETFTLAER